MDRRIAKTQNALIQALGQCISRYRWEDVTVQLLCDTADVSRSTFYAHFEDKQDLLALAVKTMVARLVAEDQGTRNLGLNGKISILPALLRHMREHLFLFEATRSSMAGRALAHHFETSIGHIIREEVTTSSKHRSMPEHQILFLIGGLFAVLDDWRERSCETPDDDVLRILDRATDLVTRNQG